MSRLRQLKAGLKAYLLISALLFNLLLGYGFTLFTHALYSYSSLPAALLATADRIDNPLLKPIASTIRGVSKILNSPNYFSKPFDIDDWPMVGPSANSLLDNHQTRDHIITVSTTNELINAFKTVKSGETIIVEDGQYPIARKRIDLIASGSETHPIKVIARNTGKAIIALDSLEGLYISKPYWQITGLHFVGKCNNDSKCDHAIHVVGDAHHTLISHNTFVDFNAAVKVNEFKGKYPDNGTIYANHFYATHTRETSRSVTPINLDHGSNWLISRNIIRDFVKGGGNQVSYGAFMKGGSQGGMFENNLIICSTSTKAHVGSTVGLSVGGGGMANRRDKVDYEAQNSVIRNNLIFHCNDVGIYINKGANTVINNNTLYNTTGIDIRFPQSSADIINNILSGEIRNRDNATIVGIYGNQIFKRHFLNNSDSLNTLFVEPQIGNFTFSSDPTKLHLEATPYPISVEQTVEDFCGSVIKRSDVFSGAVAPSSVCFR